MSSRAFAYCVLPALLACPLLAGCADDAALPRAALPASDRALPPASPAAPRRAALAPALPTTAPDALEAPDALLAGTSAAPGPSPILPLSGPGAHDAAAFPAADDALTRSPDALAPSPDALVQSSDTLAGRTVGQSMPTLHSHWLVGTIFNARVQVRVNGLFLGTFTSPQDRDITMKLRNGINTLTLAYTPLESTASAHLDVLESEHDPPIPPLATFRSPSFPAGPRAPLPTTTQTLTFLAR